MTKQQINEAARLSESEQRSWMAQGLVQALRGQTPEQIDAETRLVARRAEFSLRDAIETGLRFRFMQQQGTLAQLGFQNLDQYAFVTSGLRKEDVRLCQKAAALPMELVGELRPPKQLSRLIVAAPPPLWPVLLSVFGEAGNLSCTDLEGAMRSGLVLAQREGTLDQAALERVRAHIIGVLAGKVRRLSGKKPADSKPSARGQAMARKLRSLAKEAAELSPKEDSCKWTDGVWGALAKLVDNMAAALGRDPRTLLEALVLGPGGQKAERVDGEKIGISDRLDGDQAAQPEATPGHGKAPQAKPEKAQAPRPNGQPQPPPQQPAQAAAPPPEQSASPPPEQSAAPPPEQSATPPPEQSTAPPPAQGEQPEHRTAQGEQPPPAEPWAVTLSRALRQTLEEPELRTLWSHILTQLQGGSGEPLSAMLAQVAPRIPGPAGPLAQNIASDVVHPDPGTAWRYAFAIFNRLGLYDYRMQLHLLRVADLADDLRGVVARKCLEVPLYEDLPPPQVAPGTDPRTAKLQLLAWQQQVYLRLTDTLQHQWQQVGPPTDEVQTNVCSQSCNILRYAGRVLESQTFHHQNRLDRTRF